MAVDLATLAIRVDALEVTSAEKRLDSLSASGAKAERAAGGMNTMFKALAGTLATVKIIQLARDAANMANRYETMGAAMVVVGNNAGYTREQMGAYEQQLRSTGIAMIEARETLTKMASAQIDLAKSSDLARIAQDAAVIGNLNSSEAFNRMIDGIRSGEVEILKTIGLGVNFEAAYKRTAAQLGKNSDELTTLEKTQARVNETMRAGELISGTYEASMGTAGKQIKSLDRYLDDLQVRFGEAFGPATTMLVGQLTGELKGITSWAGQNEQEIAEWGKTFRSVIISIEAELIRLSMLIDKVGGTLTTIVALAGTLGRVDLDPTSAAITGQTDSSVTEWGKKWNKVYEDRYNAGEKALQGLANLEMNLANTTTTGSASSEQAWIKQGAAAQKAREAEEQALATKKKGESAEKKHTAALREQEKATRAAREEVEKIADAYKKEAEYKDDVSRALMTSREREIDDIKDINEELETKINYLVRERGLSEDIAKTWKAQLGQKMAQDIKAANEQLSEMDRMFEDVAKNIQGAFADMFEDLFDGGLKSLSNFGDSLLSMFKRVLAQMATMAIAQPIIVPIVQGVGNAMGVSEAGMSQVLGSSGMGGSSSLGMATNAASIIGSGASSGYQYSTSLLTQQGQELAVQNAAMFAEELGFTATAETISNMSVNAFGAWTAGIGTFISGLLNGEDVVRAGAKGLGAAGGAYAGASAGSYFGPVGTLIGGAAGALLGALGVDKLFGGDKKNYFGIDQGVQQGSDTTFYASSGFSATGTYFDPNYNETAKWYHPIATAYSGAIAAVQGKFNEQVFAFTNTLPAEMKNQVLGELARTDFSSALASSSAGKWESTQGKEAITEIAGKYANALTSAFGRAYAVGLANYINTQGPAGLLGDEATWNLLSTAAQENVKSIFASAANAIYGGDIEGGISSINSVGSIFNQIKQAMAPIAEIIATDGMTEYEKSIRSINKQFDQYAVTLAAAGVDLAKYTDLEKARGIMLADVQKEQTSAAEAEARAAEAEARRRKAEVSEGAYATRVDFQRAQWDAYYGRSFDVGTSFVPYDMGAKVHRGEIIVDRKSADVLRKYGISGSDKEVSAKLDALIAEIAALRAEQRGANMQIGIYTKKAADLAEKADAIGSPPARAEL